MVKGNIILVMNDGLPPLDIIAMDTLYNTFFFVLFFPPLPFFQAVPSGHPGLITGNTIPTHQKKIKMSNCFVYVSINRCVRLGWKNTFIPWKMCDINDNPIKLSVKWNGKEYEIPDFSPSDSVAMLKIAIENATGVRPERQKLLNVKFQGK